MDITGALIEQGAATIEKNVAGNPTISWESGKAVSEGYRSSRKIMHGDLEGSLHFIPSTMGGY